MGSYIKEISFFPFQDKKHLVLIFIKIHYTDEKIVIIYIKEITQIYQDFLKNFRMKMD